MFSLSFAVHEAVNRSKRNQMGFHRDASMTMWKQATLYGLLLALGTFALQWLDYQRMARVHAGDIYDFLLAELGISPRELAVLREIAAGHSNKQIAARLHVSPNTVKTHVARLFDKLGARRRTEALRKARELGLVP